MRQSRSGGGLDVTDKSDAWVEVRIGDIAWHVAADRRDEAAAWIGRHVPHLLDDERAVLKRTPSSRVAADDGWVLKESLPGRGLRASRFAVRRSAARRAADLGRRLIALGIATPEPLAWATVRRRGLRVRDYLVTRRIVGCQRLTEWLRMPDLSDSDRQRLVERLGRSLAQFHANGYLNRDMKDANLLVAETPDPTVWVVDLDGVRRAAHPWRRQILRDFWTVVRSLRKNGWDETRCKKWLAAAYDAAMPRTRRIGHLPDRFPNWAA
jgi:tRNA A-37 threonylcarbamoyl transferase component Bud32